jgi:hypothetical protein
MSSVQQIQEAPEENIRCLRVILDYCSEQARRAGIDIAALLIEAAAEAVDEEIAETPAN